MTGFQLPREQASPAMRRGSAASLTRSPRAVARPCQPGQL